jgi:replication initiation and membrane attachment protein DnaB
MEVEVGVERAVTRWYVQRQVLLNEIASLQAKLANQQSQPAAREEQIPDDTGTEAKAEAETRADIERKHADAQKRLLALGPCPKTMMG